jgi:hypothetical protein
VEKEEVNRLNLKGCQRSIALSFEWAKNITFVERPSIEEKHL